MTVAYPLRPSRWTDEQARMLSRVSRHAVGHVITPVFPSAGHGRGAWNIRMHAVCCGNASWSHRPPDHGDNAGHDAYRLVGLEWNGARLWLRLPARACNDWLSLRMPDLQIDPLPAAFIDAAWDAMLQEAWNALGIGRLCPGLRAAPDGLPEPGTRYPYAWRLSLRSSDGAASVDAELAADDQGLRELAAWLARMPAQAADDVPCMDALTIPVLARAGQTVLGAAELRGLAIGDVVMFDVGLADPDGNAWLATPDGQCVRVRATGPGASRYVVTQEWSRLPMNDYPTSDDPYAGMDHGYPPPDKRPDAREGSLSSGDDPYPDPAPYGLDADPAIAGQECALPPQGARLPRDPCDDAAAVGGAPSIESADGNGKADGLDVDRIPVRLDFDLGEHRMTLGELRRLRPGEFFDLQRRIDAGPVHIRANGTLIGTAELVDIDGRIGARVLTLVPAGRDSCG
ncbi:type III secretion system cytoplasmic ring protein SctQ [Bordetella bronchialis]